MTERGELDGVQIPSSSATSRAATALGMTWLVVVLIAPPAKHGDERSGANCT